MNGPLAGGHTSKTCDEWFSYVRTVLGNLENRIVYVDFDPYVKFLSVTFKIMQRTWTIKFRNFTYVFLSADWPNETTARAYTSNDCSIVEGCSFINIRPVVAEGSPYDCVELLLEKISNQICFGLQKADQKVKLEIRLCEEVIIYPLDDNKYLEPGITLGEN